MGHLAPLLLALILNCCGICIFTKPKSYDCLPYISHVIFLLSIFFLLLELHLIPCYIQELYSGVHYIIEFTIAMLLMEFIVNNLWFPLQVTFLNFLPEIPRIMSNLMRSFGFKCHGICRMLKFLTWPGTIWCASYLMSIFFFLCLSQATRILDFRLLANCGIYHFVMDAVIRAEEYWRDMLKAVKNGYTCLKKSVPFIPKPKRGRPRKGCRCRAGFASENDIFLDPNNYAATFDSDDFFCSDSDDWL